MDSKQPSAHKPTISTTQTIVDFLRMRIFTSDFPVFLFQFYLFEAQLEQFELATDRAVKNEILNQAARDLPIYCRTNAGGKGWAWEQGPFAKIGGMGTLGGSVVSCSLSLWRNS